jgi:hypothetical protein
VAINGDRLPESNEDFSVDLSGSPNYTIDSGHAIGVIVDDEPHVSIDNGPVSVTEGNSGTTNAVFTVRLAAAYDAPVVVSYATSDGSATVAGGDYQAQSGAVTIPAGNTSQTFTAVVNGDRLPESNEDFSVDLSGSPNYTIDSGHATGLIVDDEPRISINSVSVTEGNSGTKPMNFTVTLSVAYDQAVTVHFATHDDSATVAGKDYVATSGTLTFAPGQTSTTITVTINGDKKNEPNESFYVLLSGASSNALISSAYGWGTIVDDDGHGQHHASVAAVQDASGAQHASAAVLSGLTHSPSVPAQPSAVVRTRKAAAVDQVIAVLGGKRGRSGLRIPDAIVARPPRRWDSSPTIA